MLLTTRVLAGINIDIKLIDVRARQSVSLQVATQQAASGMPQLPCCRHAAAVLRHAMHNFADMCPRAALPLVGVMIGCSTPELLVWTVLSADTHCCQSNLPSL